MSKQRLITALLVFAVLVCAALAAPHPYGQAGRPEGAALAEDAKLEFPEVTDKKPSHENHWHIFNGDKKVGFNSELIFSVKHNGEECLLYEGTAVENGGLAGSEAALTFTYRMLVRADDMTPIFMEDIRKAEGYSFELRVKVEHKDGRQVFTAHKSVNGKECDKVVENDKEDPAYFANTLTDVYALKHMRFKENAALRYFSSDSLSLSSERIKYVEKKEATWQGEKTTVYVTESSHETRWYDKEGRMLRAFSEDSSISGVRTDAAGAAKADLKLDDYAAPAFLKEGKATLGALGLRMTMPEGLWRAHRGEDDDSLFIRDSATDTGMLVMGFTALPDRVGHKELLERYKSMRGDGADGIQYEFGEGEMVEAGGKKILKGALKSTLNVEETSGVYFVLIEGKRGAIIMLQSLPDKWKDLEAALVSCVEGIEWVEQSPPPKAPAFVSKKWGLGVSAPEAWWQIDEDASEPNKVCDLFCNWSHTFVLITADTVQEGVTLERIHQIVKARLAEDKNVKVMREMKRKAGGLDALGMVWTDVNAEKGEKKKVIMRVMFLRDKTLFTMTAVCNEDAYAGVVDELEKIIKNISFVE